jgi:hypothetical protein
MEPEILNAWADVYPARVAADGNCLYRAISKVICGNEALFILLRIFTLLEILSYPMFHCIELCHQDTLLHKPHKDTFNYLFTVIRLQFF